MSRDPRTWPLPIRWAALGGCISIVLAGVLLLFGPATHTPNEDRDDEVIDLVGPSGPAGEAAAADGLLDPNLGVSLPEGGWIQIAGSDGRLAQQYRFTHLDPDPADLPIHWVRMDDPEVELYMRGGRLVTLSGKQADAYTPRRAMEQGRLIGDVVIRMYEGGVGTYPDPDVVPPALTITTPAAEFDNLSGRITCAGRINVVTPSEELRGSDLTILLNDRDNRIEYLEVATVDDLILRDVGARRAPPSTARRPGSRIIRPVARTGVRVEDTPDFYLLRLDQNVRIEQTHADDPPDARPRVVTANALEAVFSLESSALQDRSAPTGPTAMRLETLVVTSALGAAQDATTSASSEQVHITCDGPLIMVPLDDDDRTPPSADATDLRLIGTPVRIRDQDRGVAIDCSRVDWASTTERVDLQGGDDQDVVILTEEVEVVSSHAWAQPDRGRAGIDAPGHASLTSGAGLDDTTEPVPSLELATPESPTTVHWTRSVNLRFDSQTQGPDAGLESIQFNGDVAVNSADGTIDAQQLEMRFVPDDAGGTTPERLIGSGEIAARNGQQTLWTDQLIAMLVPDDSGGDDREPHAVTIGEFLATGDVQVLMADGARVWADRMQGDGAQESVTLTGDDVTIIRDEVRIDQGTDVRIERLAGTARWSGPGRATLGAEPINVSDDRRMERPALGQSGDQETRITWARGVDLAFDPDQARQESAMRSIVFDESVAVRSPDGTMDAELVEMRFAPGADGRAQPERLICERRVRAHNESQTLWADQLIATLEPGEGGDDTAETDTETFGEGVVIRDFLATGDVQVLMANGARAFADRLEGEARQETVDLSGDVVVAREDVILDRGDTLRIDRLDGTAWWPGPGRSRMVRTPLALDTDARIVRPRVPSPDDISMRTAWTESLLYDSTFAEGAGAMDLTGDVSVVVDRTEVQRSSLDGESVRLEFARLDEGAARSEADDADPLASGNRVLSRLIARGDARLESRTWKTPHRDVLPRVFYVGARHITWNDIDTEAEIVGEGDIVIREPTWAHDEQEHSRRGGGGPFSGPGTSRFVWTRRLDLVREADDRFRMTMRGGVEGLWKGALDDRDAATITAEEVHVLTRRGDEASATADAPLQLGADMEVDRLRAVERVYLATPTRRADCHMLEYNTRTNIAELVARAGRTVSLLTEGSPLPVQATRMIWNMDPAIDTITLEHPRGAGSR